MAKSLRSGGHRPRYYLVLVALLLTLPASAKRKDDVVVMKNGDRFTGEIKGLERGVLKFKADYMEAAIKLNWNEVAIVQSKDPFILSFVSGSRLIGNLQVIKAPHGAPEVRVTTGERSTMVEHSDLIRIQQQERGLVKQLNGSVDLGFTFASHDTTTNYAFSSSVGYVSDLRAFNLTATSDLSQTGDESTARHNLSVSYERMLNRKWFVGTLADFLHSEQQDLSLRSTFGAGIGRWLFQSDHTSLSVLGGGVYTRENYSPNVVEDPNRSNAEGLFAARFTTFRFKTTEVTTAARFFPSISDPGRYRIGFDGSVKFELLRDLYWKFSVYDDYDSRPPANLEKNAVGITTSLGWSF